MLDNLLLPASTYRALRLVSPFRPLAKNLLKQFSGVEPALFIARPLFDRTTDSWQRKNLDRWLAPYCRGQYPLGNRQHGVRLHGLTDFSLYPDNNADYLGNQSTAVALLANQVNLTWTLAKINGVDDARYPSLFTIHLGQSTNDRAKDLENFAATLRSVLPLAQEKNVIISVENVLDRLTNRHWLGADLEDFARLFNLTGDHPNLGLTFDFAHALIQYRGNWQKINSLLEKHDLFKKIYHLHFALPAADYLNRYDRLLTPKKLSWPRLLWSILFASPDNQADFDQFFRRYAKEKNDYLAWIKQISQRSATNQPRYNCATLELSFKIPLTDSGATLSGLDRSRQLIKTVLND